MRACARPSCVRACESVCLVGVCVSCVCVREHVPTHVRACVHACVTVCDHGVISIAAIGTFVCVCCECLPSCPSGDRYPCPGRPRWPLSQDRKSLIPVMQTNGSSRPGPARPFPSRLFPARPGTTISECRQTDSPGQTLPFPALPGPARPVRGFEYVVGGPWRSAWGWN
jgi:hypothetical protein